MHFTWDEEKNRSNLRKHKVSFETAALVFDDPMHLSVQDRVTDGERCWQTIGIVGGIAILLVAHTIEGEGDEIIRIISARKATVQERKRYDEGES